MTSKHTTQTVTSTVTTNLVTPAFKPTSTVNPSLNTIPSTPFTHRTAAPTSQATTSEKSSSSKQTSPLTSRALTSAEIISTSSLRTVSHSTSIIIPVSNATTPHCTDNDCPGCAGTCAFNTTLGGCHCHCQEFVFGDLCVFGENDTSAQIDTGAIPPRKANITLEIQITFQAAFRDLSSPESLEFIETLEQELEALCKEADPQSYKKVQVIKLSPGSVVAESVVEYIYANNETQIQFINTQLDGVLTGILNKTSNLNKISQAFNASVQLNGLTFQSPEIKNITDLKPFVNCSQFANYTAEISNGQWQCVGPCKTNPNYCHQHGECRNDVYKGPTCSCFESSLEQFYGPQCDLFRYGPGFYGALFGSLAGALLLIIIIVIAVIIFKKRHMSVWKIRNNRRLSAFEEDFYDFSDTGDHSFGFAGTYTSEGFRPHLQNVDTQVQVTTRRPEVLNISPR
ncbi:mucin-3B [Chelmon rostratus]|uniref:mucin-3B n=1 Tax=Chelmon rostratus TaxID=109905 RepID=UPI001BE8934C|nr:mucin-3B [Chelmon rostratus]